MLSGAAQNGANNFNAAAREASTIAGTTSSGPGENGGGNPTKADREATQPKFGDVMQDMQTKYGAKAEKPREIKKTLGKDDFLRIMVTQMKFQDPTSPFKPDQMAAQMAQFASVEQLQNVNQNIAKMAGANQPMERLAMTSLIGKTVTIDRNRFPHLEGTNESLGFTLPADAKNVHVAIVSDNGDVIFEKDLGSHKAGDGTFGWDGMKANGLAAKPGNYMLRVEAKNQHDQNMPLESKTQARVVGVSFEGQEPVFLVGDSKHQEKVLMKNVVKIDENGMGLSSLSPSVSPAMGQPAGQAPGQSAGPPAEMIKQAMSQLGQQMGQAPAQAGAEAAAAAAAPAPNNFFNFQKGVGSQTMPGAPQGSAPQPQSVAQASAQIGAGERGFANGLHDSNDGADAPSSPANPLAPAAGGKSGPLNNSQGSAK